MGGLKGTRREENCTGGLTGKSLNEQKNLEDLGVDVRITVK
jgi:hypothetical protein